MRRLIWTYLGLYAVLACAALPLAMGWVPPNRWYGFRLPGASLSPQLWYEINALGGKLFVAGLVLCAAVNAMLLWRGTRAVHAYLPWINAALILLNFWLVTSELLLRLPS
jgi:hypothetical protein